MAETPRTNTLLVAMHAANVSLHTTMKSFRDAALKPPPGVRPAFLLAEGDDAQMLWQFKSPPAGDPGRAAAERRLRRDVIRTGSAGSGTIDRLRGPTVDAIEQAFKPESGPAPAGPRRVVIVASGDCLPPQDRDIAKLKELNAEVHVLLLQNSTRRPDPELERDWRRALGRMGGAGHSLTIHKPENSRDLSDRDIAIVNRFLTDKSSPGSPAAARSAPARLAAPGRGAAPPAASASSTAATAVPADARSTDELLTRAQPEDLRRLLAATLRIKEPGLSQERAEQETRKTLDAIVVREGGRIDRDKSHQSRVAYVRRVVNGLKPEERALAGRRALENSPNTQLVQKVMVAATGRPTTLTAADSMLHPEESSTVSASDIKRAFEADEPFVQAPVRSADESETMVTLMLAPAGKNASGEAQFRISKVMVGEREVTMPKDGPLLTKSQLKNDEVLLALTRFFKNEADGPRKMGAKSREEAFAEMLARGPSPERQRTPALGELSPDSARLARGPGTPDYTLG